MGIPSISSNSAQQSSLSSTVTNQSTAHIDASFSTLSSSSIASSLDGNRSSLKSLFFTVWNRALNCFAYLKRLFFRYFPCFRRPISYSALSMAMPNPSTATALQQIYWRLARNKWKEGIDGCYHRLGPGVFDEGLHGGPVEPGYLRSLLNSFTFVSDHLEERLTTGFYLDLHRVLCSHFRGLATETLMGQEKVGVFRDSNDGLQWTIRNPYIFTNEAVQEYYAFEQELRQHFSLSTDEALGYLTYQDPHNRNSSIGIPYGQLPPQGVCVTLKYRVMPREEVANFMQFFIEAFYQEIERVQGDEEAKLTAIARFSQRLEWLHPTKDGSGRTDMAVLNKLLTEHGFHPAIIDHPWNDVTLPLASWKAYLRESLNKWEREQPVS